MSASGIVPAVGTEKPRVSRAFGSTVETAGIEPARHSPRAKPGNSLAAWTLAFAATIAGVLLIAAFILLAGLYQPAVHQIAPPAGYQLVNPET